MNRLSLGLAVGVALTCATGASAGYVFSQTTAAAPTYSTVLNFDEPGTPTGLVPPNTWVPNYGVSINGGCDFPFVGDLHAVYGSWAGTGNAIEQVWGLFYNFTAPVTEMSFQAWDPSGPPSPFGGGLVIALLKNGVDVGGASFTPAWGGVGKTWYNITTSSGSTFDEIRVFGNGFVPDTIMDNLSWNTVPAPGAIALLGLGGLVGRGRRRN
ncbi:MAG: hypothetical protein U0572_08695 [Phycisphaerales bacterium]